LLDGVRSTAAALAANSGAGSSIRSACSAWNARQRLTPPLAG